MHKRAVDSDGTEDAEELSGSANSTVEPSAGDGDLSPPLSSEVKEFKASCTSIYYRENENSFSSV